MSNTLVKILKDKNLLTMRPKAMYVKFYGDNDTRYYSSTGEWLKGYVPKSAEAYLLS